MVPEKSATEIKRITEEIAKVINTIRLEGVIFADAAGAGSEALRFFMSRFVFSAGFISAGFILLVL
jgi:hypothetical protein